MASKMVDRNGVRGGAGVSAVILLIAFVIGDAARAVVPAMAVVLAVGAFFGLRYSLLGMTYRFIKKTFKLSIPVEPEEEAPPRFAQLIGFVVLALATVGFYPLSSDAIGWALALLVAGLQALLATTGICVGCEIYLYTRRFAAKGA